MMLSNDLRKGKEAARGIVVDLATWPAEVALDWLSRQRDREFPIVVVGPADRVLAAQASEAGADHYVEDRYDAVLRSLVHALADSRRIAGEAQRLRTELSKARAAKTQFMANMSHELRTPLNAILGFSDAIRSEVFGRLPHAQYEDYVRCINEAGRSLMKTVEDLLGLSHFEQLLRAGETDYRRIIDLAPDLICICRDGRIAMINAMGASMLGAPRPEALLGLAFDSFAADSPSAIDLAGLPKEGARLTLQLRRFDGSMIELDAAATLLPAPAAETSDLTLLVARDVTEMRRQMAELRDERAKMADILETVADAVLTVDREGNIEIANRAAAVMLGVPGDALVGRSIGDFLPNLAKDWLCTCGTGASAEQKLIRTGGIRTSGVAFTAEVVARCGQIGSQGRCVMVMRDISDRLIAEDRLRFLAFHDQVTGLPNRQFIVDHLRHRIATGTPFEPMAVVVVDLKRFRALNSLYGATFCDVALVMVGQRLTDATGGAAIVCRTGNDEFTLIFHAVTGQEDLPLQAITSAIRQPIHLDGQELHLEAGIGIALFPEDGQTPDALLRGANAAVQVAKRAGERPWCRYSPRLDREAQQRALIEAGLRHAINRNELAVHYQPRVCMATGQPIAAEALMRWTPSALGVIPPDRFIPVAESTGVILPLTEWLISRACGEARTATEAGQPLPISVNISPRQFLQPNFTERIAAIIQEHDFAPELLELEITERVVMNNEQEVIGCLKKIKDMGISIAMDDFGTGYSSLAYLKKFPLDIIKIDKSFVSGVPSERCDVAIVSTIVSISRSLHLTVVAEGVETTEQRDVLLDHGCDAGQGYLFARPMPPLEFTEYLRARPHAPVSLPC